MNTPRRPGRPKRRTATQHGITQTIEGMVRRWGTTHPDLIKPMLVYLRKSKRKEDSSLIR